MDIKRTLLLIVILFHTVGSIGQLAVAPKVINDFIVVDAIAAIKYSVEFVTDSDKSVNIDTDLIILEIDSNISKAIASFSGRTWEAWFTNQIHVSDGPC